jgi:hypothetical protein
VTWCGCSSGDLQQVYRQTTHRYAVSSHSVINLPIARPGSRLLQWLERYAHCSVVHTDLSNSCCAVLAAVQEKSYTTATTTIKTR